MENFNNYWINIIQIILEKFLGSIKSGLTNDCGSFYVYIYVYVFDIFKSY